MITHDADESSSQGLQQEEPTHISTTERLAKDSLAPLLQAAQSKAEAKSKQRQSSLETEPTTGKRPISLDEIESFDDFGRSRTNITRNQLEWMYRTRNSNGLKGAFFKIGKRRYVHPGLLVQCLLEQAD